MKMARHLVAIKKLLNVVRRNKLNSLHQYLQQFGSPSEKAKEELSKISTIISVKKSSDLQPIGHTCKTIYFLQKGLARIYYFKVDIDITESFSFENSIVVRFESLFAGQPSKKGIQALEDSEFIAINATKLNKLYDSYPEIERLFRKITEAELVQNINRVESIQFHTADERYKALLKEAPDVLRRVPLKYVASYLGITQVSLSRIRAQK